MEQGDHNHNPLSVSVLPSVQIKGLTPAIRRKIKLQITAIITPRQITAYLQAQYPNLSFKASNIYNIKYKIREKNLNGKTLFHALAWHLINLESEACSQWLLNKDGSKVIYLFRAAHSCLDVLTYYSDVLIFDCTYRINRNDFDLFNIVGNDCL